MLSLSALEFCAPWDWCRPLVKSLVLGVFYVQRFEAWIPLLLSFSGTAELTYTFLTPRDERVLSVTPPLTVKNSLILMKLNLSCRSIICLFVLTEK